MVHLSQGKGPEKDKGKTIMLFPVSALTKVRIVCAVCDTAIELKIENLPNVKDLACPGCADPRNPLRITSSSADAFGDLAKAIYGLKTMKKVELEFVIPQEDAV